MLIEQRLRDLFLCLDNCLYSYLIEQRLQDIFKYFIFSVTALSMYLSICVCVSQKRRVAEAEQRYEAALKQVPEESSDLEVTTFHDIKISLLLKLSHCKRRQKVGTVNPGCL